ncbi:MAG: hypothetical protein ACYCOU_04375 [Sulfobacillus sp.]
MGKPGTEIAKHGHWDSRNVCTGYVPREFLREGGTRSIVFVLPDRGDDAEPVDILNYHCHRAVGTTGLTPAMNDMNDDEICRTQFETKPRM